MQKPPFLGTREGVTARLLTRGAIHRDQTTKHRSGRCQPPVCGFGGGEGLSEVAVVRRVNCGLSKARQTGLPAAYQAKVLTCVPNAPDVASAGWGMDCCMALIRVLADEA